MAMRKCNRCGERKSEREFYPTKQGGLMTRCAHCERANSRNRYHGENRRRIQQRVLANYHHKRAEQRGIMPDDENGSVAA